MSSTLLQYQQVLALFANTPNADGAGGWLDVSAANIAKAFGAIDDSTFIYFNPGAIGAFWEADYGLTPPPVEASINFLKVYIRAWCRSHNNIAVDHTLFASVKPGGGARFDSAGQVVTGTPNFVGDNPQVFVFLFTVNPATGLAWTLPDLAGVKVAPRIRVDTDPTAASTPYFIISSVNVELETVLTVASTEAIRRKLSISLQRRRRSPRIISLTTRGKVLDNELLQPVWLESPLYPTPDGLGTSLKPWSRRPLIILGQTIQPDDPDRTAIKAIDPRPYSQSFWSPLRTTLGLTDDLSGIARVDAGGGWSCTRARKVYCERPGDRFLREWDNDKLAFTVDGLWAGNISNDLLNSSFSQWAAGNPSTWVLTTEGAGSTGTQDTADYLIEASGLTSSIKITNGAAGTDRRYYYQEASRTNVVQRVKIRYKNDSGQALTWRLEDRTAAQDWNDTTGTWVAPTVHNSLPVSTSPAKFLSKLITAVAGAHTYRLTVGRMTAAGAISHLYNVVWIPVAIMPLVDCVTTTAALSTLVADFPSIGNDLGSRVWFPDQGTVVLRFLPAFSHTDLIDGQAVRLLNVRHAATGAAESDRLLYQRDTASTASLIFRRRRATVNYDATYAGMQTLFRDTGTYTFSLRWTSAAGELGLPARTHSVFYNGILGAAATIPTDMPIVDGPWPPGVDGGPRVWLGYDASAPGSAEGIISDLTIWPIALTDEEIRREGAPLQ